MEVSKEKERFLYQLIDSAKERFKTIFWAINPVNESK